MPRHRTLTLTLLVLKNLVSLDLVFRIASLIFFGWIYKIVHDSYFVCVCVAYLVIIICCFLLTVDVLLQE